MFYAAILYRGPLLALQAPGRAAVILIGNIVSWPSPGSALAQTAQQAVYTATEGLAGRASLDGTVAYHGFFASVPYNADSRCTFHRAGRVRKPPWRHLPA